MTTKLPIHINLRDFLVTGKLGPIQLGMSRQEVLDQLGEPSRNHMMNAYIWRYDDFEFYFPENNPEDSDLYMIFTDHLPLSSSDYFQVDVWHLTPNLHIAEARELLEGESIAHQQIDHSGSICYSDIQVESGVKLGFHPPEEADSCEDLFLTAISVKRQLRTTPQKQIGGLMVPLHVYEKIRAISQTERTSISKICSRWIVEYVENLDNKE